MKPLCEINPADGGDEQSVKCRADPNGGICLSHPIMHVVQFAPLSHAGYLQSVDQRPAIPLQTLFGAAPYHES